MTFHHYMCPLDESPKSFHWPTPGAPGRTRSPISMHTPCDHHSRSLLASLRAQIAPTHALMVSMLTPPFLFRPSRESHSYALPVNLPQSPGYCCSSVLRPSPGPQLQAFPVTTNLESTQYLQSKINPEYPKDCPTNLHFPSEIHQV